MEKDRIVVNDAFIYFLSNSVDPTAVDSEMYRQVDRDLKASPCVFEVPQRTEKPKREIVIPTEGQPREVFDSFFRRIGIHHSEVDPDIVEFVAKVSLGMNGDRVNGNGCKSSTIHGELQNPVAGKEYTI